MSATVDFAAVLDRLAWQAAKTVSRYEAMPAAERFAHLVENRGELAFCAGWIGGTYDEVLDRWEWYSGLIDAHLDSYLDAKENS